MSSLSDWHGALTASPSKSRGPRTAPLTTAFMMKPSLPLVTTFALLLMSTTAQATPPGEYAQPLHIKPLESSAPENRVLGEALLSAARQTELAGSHERAAALYASAAAHQPDLNTLLLLRAGSNMLQASTPPSPIMLTALLGEELLAPPHPELADVQLELTLAAYPERIPSGELLNAAIDIAREPTCTRLMMRYPTTDLRALHNSTPRPPNLPALLDTLHGHCEEDLEASSSIDALKLPVSASARTSRAALLIGHVHFNATLNEIRRIKRAAQTTDERCHTDFLKARATYRIRKTRKKAQALYQHVADSCTRPEQELWRRRSLYAMGKRMYNTGKPDSSRTHFTTLLTDYPNASHADDAIMYLARIARDANDQDTQLALMQRAVKDHASGDMLHEIVWEALEPLVREERDQEFLDALASLALPKRDDQYFSQGRLEYFKAVALKRLGKTEDALIDWSKLWKKYPFSFYGYLAWVRAIEGGIAPNDLKIARTGDDLTWIFDEAWVSTPEGTLTRHGLFDWAARYAPSKTPDDLWRLATLHHLAGHYPISHNIARRRIDGIPWNEGDEGRLARWHVTWPAPFVAPVVDAIDAERPQHDASVMLHAAFPLSIMREESSFIPDIVSYAGALGLMQLMHATAKDHDNDLDEQPVTKAQLRTAEINVRVGVDHLYTLSERMGSHPVLMAASYNAGAGAVRKWLKAPRSRDIALWIEDVPYLQARDYTKRVIGSYVAYQWMLGADEFDINVGKDAQR